MKHKDPLKINKKSFYLVFTCDNTMMTNKMSLRPQLAVQNRRIYKNNQKYIYYNLKLNILEQICT